MEIIRLLVRLMQDFKQISLKSFVEINQAIEVVSKQLTAWGNYSKIKLSTPLKMETKKQGMEKFCQNCLLPERRRACIANPIIPLLFQVRNLARYEGILHSFIKILCDKYSGYYYSSRSS